VAGTQRRHQFEYGETMKRVHDGAIGAITSGQAYWLGDYSYYSPVRKQPGWSDMEWQLRNWNYFAWLSGDIIVEQHVHNLDVIRWAMRGDPVKCIATGSRAVRTDPVFGHIYDNFNVAYEFANGVCVLSMCRQMENVSGRVSEKVTGTKGSAWAGRIDGENKWSYAGPTPNPYVQEHTDLIAAIRSGKPINDAHEVAKSSLMAIMGRISAYTGKEITWRFVMNASKLVLRPAKYELGDLPVPPVAVPGKTEVA
jgi:predicted dehydrogenase